MPIAPSNVSGATDLGMGHFDHRKYHVLFALGRPIGAPLHIRASWERLLPVLNPIVQLARRGPEGVRSTQFVNAASDTTVPFGQLRWNQKSHASWTHSTATDGRVFIGTELWAPIWTKCAKEDLAPDVYVELTDISTIKRQALQVAICDDVADVAAAEALLLSAARACAALLDRPVLARTDRYWGRTVRTDFRGAIQDYWGQVAHALRDGANDATVGSLPGRWQPVQIGLATHFQDTQVISDQRDAGDVEK